ncbi:MAG TPA: zf-TFIIB domain-containing protein, partial [Acidimicrobiales bacterium]|nr:zf-TFIIB domain-containing protein [Acidimicrobiales bacterium]
EIDYCPQCRGVWLDRGELDKIIERSAPAPAPAPAAAPPRDDRRYDDRERRDDRYDDRGRRDDWGGGYGKKRKKESFLGELFDFG